MYVLYVCDNAQSYETRNIKVIMKLVVSFLVLRTAGSCSLVVLHSENIPVCCVLRHVGHSIATCTHKKLKNNLLYRYASKITS